MEVLIVGGGAGGQIVGLFLAGDGHDVTVLERDAQEPPDDDEAAAEDRTRRQTALLPSRRPPS